MSEEPRQYWIRNDKGTTWGPLTFATIEVLLDNGALAGKLQASRDGLNFVFPGRLTEVRDAFPKDLWGDSSQPLEDAAATPAAPVRAPPTVGAPRPAPPTEESRPAAAPTPTPAPVPKPTAPSKPPPVPQPLAAGEGVPTSGDLSEFPPFRLYYLAATTNQTGRVTLNGTEASYEVFFKKGSPEAVRSSLEEEDLGAFLLGKGLLKPDQLAAARKMAPTTGGDLLNALFGMQLLSPGDAFKHLGEHALGLLTKAFTIETRGSFSFDPKAPVPATAMPLGDRWKLVCDMVRAIPVDDIKGRLGEEALDLPIMKSGGRVELAQLKLTPQEARAAGYFDGVRSLNALCEALPNEADAIVRTAFLLYRFEACSFALTPSGEKPKSGEVPKVAKPKSGEVPAAESPTPKEIPQPEPPKVQPAAKTGEFPKPAQPRPAPPKIDPPKISAAAPAPAPKGPPQASQPAINPGRPPVVGGAGGKPVVAPPQAKRPVVAAGPPPVVKPATGPGNDPAALKTLFASLKDKNHFEALGLTAAATAPQAKTAYLQLAKQFHPDTVPAGTPPEVARLKADIFARLSEASSVVGDEKRRATYVEELTAGIDKMDASKIFASEEAFQKACLFIKARKYPDALKLIDEAIKLYEKEGEYFIWRGWARFLVAGDKRAVKDDVFKEIDKGLKMSPKCAQGVYFKGQISKLLGDVANAQKLFKETLTIDPNHLEAQREVRQR